jgi:hypothetical protein
MEKYQQFWCFRLGAITRKISREYNTRFLEFGIINRSKAGKGSNLFGAENQG